MESEETKSDFLNEIIGLTKSIENLSDDLLQHLNSKDSSVLDAIRPIIEPKRKASEVLEFYNTTIQAAKTFEEIESKIKDSGIISKSAVQKLEIEELKSNSILDLLNLLIKTINDLEIYSEIKIIAKMISDQKKQFNNYIEIVKNTTLSSLKRLPKVVDQLDLYSRFVLKHYESKKYLKEYIEICQVRLGFVNIENNDAGILQQTSNLTEYLNMVKELNTKILGRKFSKLVNDGMIQLLVLDLKTLLGKHLLKIEKDQSPYNIPFLIQLYSRLRHYDGNMVEEIESLFELKPEIMKLIFNCFIQFFGELDILENPDVDSQSEKLVILLSNILKEFSISKDAKREWISSFGASFGIYEYTELNFNFCEKCLLKITKLAESLNGRSKYIYLINNIHHLRAYFTTFSGLDIKQLIYKNCETIVGLIKIELESKSPTEAYKYLFDEFSMDKKYHLPDKEREYISEKLKEIVENLMSKKLIQGNPQELLTAISYAYTAKAKDSRIN